MWKNCLNKPFLVYSYTQWIVVDWSGILQGFDHSWGPCILLVLNCNSTQGCKGCRLFILASLSLWRLMVLQSRYRSPGIVWSHLYGHEVDLQLLELGMLPLEIFYIHSTFVLHALWADVTLESRIFFWPLPLCSPLPHEVFLSEHMLPTFRSSMCLMECWLGSHL